MVPASQPASAVAATAPTEGGRPAQAKPSKKSKIAKAGTDAKASVNFTRVTMPGHESTCHA